MTIPLTVACGHYLACGCEVATCCLDCPLPICRYDVPGGVRAVLNGQRNTTIVAMRDSGIPIAAIAGVLNVSRNTVYTVLRQLCPPRPLTATPQSVILSTVALGGSNGRQRD